MGGCEHGLALLVLWNTTNFRGLCSGLLHTLYTDQAILNMFILETTTATHTFKINLFKYMQFHLQLQYTHSRLSILMATVTHIVFFILRELGMGPLTTPLYTSPKHPSLNLESLCMWSAGISQSSVTEAMCVCVCGWV